MALMDAALYSGAMSLRHLITFALLISASPSASAHTPVDGKVWGTFGPFFHRTNTENPAAKYLTGCGLVAEGDVDQNGGVEIGLFYQDKLYLRRQGGDVLAERIKRMYITSGYRHWFVSSTSMGAAIFSSYSMGDPQVVRVDDVTADPTSARDITEYGLDFSLQWEIWGDDDTAVVADARYSASLTRKSHENADLYGVLIGFKRLVPTGRKAETD